MGNENNESTRLELEALLLWVSTLPTYQRKNKSDDETMPAKSTIAKTFCSRYTQKTEDFAGMDETSEKVKKATLKDFKTSKNLVKLLQDFDKRHFQGLSTAQGKPRSFSAVIPKMRKYVKDKPLINYSIVTHNFPDQTIKEMGDINDDEDFHKVEGILKLLLACAVVSPLKDNLISHIKNMDNQISQRLLNLLESAFGYREEEKDESLSISFISNSNPEDSIDGDDDKEKTRKEQRENKILKQENARLYKRNNDLQRLVFLLRAEKHGNGDPKKLQKELAMLEKRLNLETIECTRTQSQLKALSGKVNRLSNEAKNKAKAAENFKIQNETLRKKTDEMEEKIKRLPTEQEVHHLRTQLTFFKEIKDNITTLNTKLTSNEDLIAKLEGENNQLKNRLEEERKTYVEEMEYQKQTMIELGRKLAESQEESENAEETIQILKATKTALIQLLTDLKEEIDKKKYGSKELFAYIQTQINKLGTV